MYSKTTIILNVVARYSVKAAEYTGQSVRTVRGTVLRHANSL